MKSLAEVVYVSTCNKKQPSSSPMYNLPWRKYTLDHDYCTTWNLA